MRRRCLHIIGLFCLVGLLWSCANAPPVKQDNVIFKNPEAEKRANRLRKLLIINPDDVEKRIQLGRIFLSEDMTQEAIIELKKALKTDPERIDALLLLSLAFQKLPKPDLTKALELLKEASEIEPNNADVHLNLAQVHNKLKNEGEAIDDFKHAIELSNDLAVLVSAHLGLMAIYEKRGDSEKANKEYQAAYEIYPGVEDMIKQAEISRITPAPKYAGEELKDDRDGLHPSFKKRIKHAIEEIEKLNRR